MESKYHKEIKSISLISLNGEKVGEFDGLSYNANTISKGIYLLKIDSKNIMYSKKISIY